MAEILKEWLSERIEKPITWEVHEFGNMMKNGYIIAGVLRSYHAITDDQYFLILNSNSSADINHNWKYLTQWLYEIDVPLNENDVESIKRGRGTTLLRVFYQMFLQLDKRDRTDFIKREKEAVSSLVEKMDTRFKVEKVFEPLEPSFTDLSKPLLNEQHYIEWQRQKTAQFKDTYDFIRHKFAKMSTKIEESLCPAAVTKEPEPKKLPAREKKEIEEFELRYPCKFQNYSYKKLLQMNKDAQRKKPLLDSAWAKEFMDNLYVRLKNKADTREFQEHLRKSISETIWEERVTVEEDKLDLELAKKVMKLSQFEKQMCSQIMQTKQQARNLLRNRTQAEKEFAEQRDYQFCQFLDNLKEQIQSEGFEIDFEMKRQNTLHQKLYAEKMKRKRQHYYEICYETMLSLTDYAVKYAHSKKLTDNDIPNHFIHEWKNLFFTRQAIFDIYEPMENLLKETNIEEENVPEEEEIIRLELDRQEVLNDVEFKEYLNYEYPWILEKLIPNFDPDSEERRREYLGNRILGHTVYKLLEVKYPYPPRRPPACLPNFKSKAILRGLPDKSFTVPMQILLEKHKISIIRLECAINFCLKKFKTELVGCSKIELDFDKFIATAQSEENKELIKNMKADEEAKLSVSDDTSRFSIGLPTNCKITQTPKTIPEEEIKLSVAAELGRYAYEALSFGDSLTDYLLAAMIVEYIKDQDDINGFVLINYPNCYREVQVLEETFTGNVPPNGELLEDSDDVYIEENIIKHRAEPKDIYKNVRISKFVKDPHEIPTSPPFESYFTCYIKLKETSNILEELVIWELNKENSELIDRFYAGLGLNYSMYYEMMDKKLLGQICMYIIGEPLKSYASVFGENVLQLLEIPSSSTKRTRSKIVKAEVSSSLTRKSKGKLRKFSKTNGSSILEVVKAPESENDLGTQSEMVFNQAVKSKTDEIVSKSVPVLQEQPVKAGEPFYQYGVLPISESIGIALATCWEEYEKAYLNDMKNLFFSKRLQMNCLGPYIRFIKDKIHQIIAIPSNKQDYLSQFQKQYNDYEDDWRDAAVTKNEWHCRVKELKYLLYDVCDQRKLNAQKQRHALICDNWAFEELTTMANTYISCMQTEINMQYLILQHLQDFYYTLLKRVPSNERVSASAPLNKISREPEDAEKSKPGAEDKAFRLLKQAYLDLQLKNILVDYSNNPFNLTIENNVKIALKLINDNNDHYRALVTKEYTDVARLIPPSAKKTSEETSVPSITSEDIWKSNALKCIDEWLMGVNGELYRSSLRVLVLQYKCYHDMKLFSDHISRAFAEIQNEIDCYYNNEIESIDRLCKFIQMAIENGKKIPENLVLEEDTFVIDPNLLHFESKQPVEVLQIETDITKFTFKQLARLRSQFKIVAPSGIVLTQEFIYILQDFVVFGKDSLKGTLFPELWRRVDPEQIPKLVFSLFGETAYVDWRDFLIYCLNIRFPTVEELLEVRHNLRCKDLETTELISRYDFLNVIFWFENDLYPERLNSSLRLHLIKQFLFELYEVAEDMMNYPALLLAFCKSDNPIEGFATALSMAVGTPTCYNFEKCEEVVCNLVKLKQYKDECLACARKCANEFVEKLLNKVVDTCEGVTVEEVPYDPNEFKKKKEKGKDKGKKDDRVQSARLADKQSKNSSRRMSSYEVKMTFICPPCQVADEAAAEEGKPEEVEEEEEKKVVPDPNLCYAVSQDVLWTILRVCLPWHFELVPDKRETPYVKQVQAVVDRLKDDHDKGHIYVARFLDDINICRILHRVKKFTNINLSEEVQKVWATQDSTTKF